MRQWLSAARIFFDKHLQATRCITPPVYFRLSPNTDVIREDFWQDAD